MNRTRDLRIVAHASPQPVLLVGGCVILLSVLFWSRLSTTKSGMAALALMLIAGIAMAFYGLSLRLVISEEELIQAAGPWVLRRIGFSTLQGLSWRAIAIRARGGSYMKHAYILSATGGQEFVLVPGRFRKEAQWSAALLKAVDKHNVPIELGARQSLERSSRLAS